MVMLLVASLVHGAQAAVPQSVIDTIDAFVVQAPFDVSSFSATLYACIDANNQGDIVDFIMANSKFPSLSTTNSTVDPSFIVVSLSDDPSISSEQLEAFDSFLKSFATIGSCVATITWDTPAAGIFDTHAIYTSSGEVTYETMQAFVPLDIPMTEEEDTAGGDNSTATRTRVLRRQLNHRCGQYDVAGESGERRYKNYFNIDVLKFNCFATADCSKDKVLECTPTHDAMGLAFGWEAQGTSVAKQVGMCCRTLCNFGYASGFKRVKIAVDKISIEIEGIIGTGGDFKETAKACCEDHCTDEPTVVVTSAPSASPTPCDSQSGDCGGDPHFKTWTGHKFDYHGECDLVLVKSPSFLSGLGLNVHIRTEIRGLFSFISNVAVRIGHDTLEVTKDGLYSVNGQMLSIASTNAVTVAQISGLPVKYYSMEKLELSEKKHRFTIDLGTDMGFIHIKSFKDFLYVHMSDVTEEHFGDSVGLLGDFSTGTMLARDQTTVMHNDPDAFGQEWQVMDGEPQLFSIARTPQYPEKCLAPPTKMSSTHQRFLQEAALDETQVRAVCAAWDEDIDECVYDVMATGDIEMAHAGRD